MWHTKDLCQASPLLLTCCVTMGSTSLGLSFCPREGMCQNPKTLRALQVENCCNSPFLPCLKG